MADKEHSSSLDILGVKPIADAINKATGAMIDGVSAVMSRICLPAAEECGLLFKDKVSHWRAINLASMAKKLERKLEELKVPEGHHAHPKIAHTIMEQASWADDVAVQDMWAGLLASACTENGDDDSNLIFTNLLGQLTRLQAKIVRYACETATKEETVTGLIQAGPIEISLEKLVEITGETDIQRLDRELDCLRALDLIQGGFDQFHPGIMLAPTAIALHLYVRSQGSRLSPIEYFGLPPRQKPERPREATPVRQFP